MASSRPFFSKTAGYQGGQSHIGGDKESQPKEFGLSGQAHGGHSVAAQVADHLYIDHTSQGDEKALQHGGPGHAEGVLQQLAGILCWLVQQLFCVLHPEAPPLYLC